MRAVPAGKNTGLVGAYVAERTGCEFQDGMFQALAILDNENQFVGGVVVTDFRGHDCTVSLASENPMAWADSVKRGVFDYIFNQLGCVRVTGITKKGNRKARAFMESLGFQLEGNLRLGFDGIKDALVYGLLARECRYLDAGGFNGDVQEHAETPDPARPMADGASTGGNEQGHGDSERLLEQDQPVHAARVD